MLNPRILPRIIADNPLASHSCSSVFIRGCIYFRHNYYRVHPWNRNH